MIKYIFTKVLMCAVSLHVIASSGQNLQEIERRLSDLESRQNTANAECPCETKALQRRLSAVESLLITSREETKALESRLTTNREETETLQRHLSAVESRQNTSVYFTAYTSSVPVAVGDASPIIFDAVVTNVGAAYNPRLGIFTAPVIGDYVFYGQIMHDARQAREYIKWVIDKSGTPLCANEVNGLGVPSMPSSCLATVRLQRGDHVFIRRDRGQHLIHGGQWCTFSGYLLSA